MSTPAPQEPARPARSPKITVGTVVLAAIATSVMSVIATRIADRAIHAGAPPAATDRPPLCVVIVVDQMRGDTLTRLGPLLQGGIARLAREGVVYDDAHQDHAATLTGPGHATLFTGVQPAVSGIIANAWYDRAGAHRAGCVSGAATGPSPTQLLVSTLGEWMQQVSPASRVVAVSGKDRAAILPAGHAKDAAVFWYDTRSGGFTTSKTYAPDLPELVARFNGDHGAKTRLCTVWERSTGSEPIPGVDPDDEPWEPAERRVFPHPLPCDRDGASTSPGASAQDAIGRSIVYDPSWDEMTLDFAETLIDEYALGKDASPDLLVLGLSGTDAIGHEWGPDSQEFADQILRLDRRLGVFLDSLDRRFGAGRVLIALGADHGVTPPPERGASKGYERVGPEAFAARLEERMRRALGPPPREQDGSVPHGSDEKPSWILAAENFDLYLARPAAGGPGARAIEDAAVAALLEEPSIAHVYRSAELAALPASQPFAATLDAIGAAEGMGAEVFAASRTGPDLILPLMRASWMPDRSGDVTYRLRPGWLIEPSDVAATHGSPYRIDTHITLIVRGPGVAARHEQKRVSARQLAPTLAHLLGAEAPTGTAPPLW